MRERPILMNADMVRAILAGTKTQTRRPLNPQPPDGTDFVDMLSDGDGKTFYAWGPECDRLPNAPTWSCPLGVPGDRLWVREPGRVVGLDQQEEESVHLTIEYIADKAQRGLHLPERFDPQETNVWPSWVKVGRGIPNGIFREAARYKAVVQSVRVERLQEITEAGAIAEGFTPGPVRVTHMPGRSYISEENTALSAFFITWNNIYKARGLGVDANPWVSVTAWDRMVAI